MPQTVRMPSTTSVYSVDPAPHPAIAYASYVQAPYVQAAYHGYGNVYSYQHSSHPVYSQASNGIPINISHGVVRQEATGVFIGNLNHSVTEAELRRMLKKIAEPVECRIHTKPGSSRPGGSATARFLTAEEASRVVERLDRKPHRERTLNVRLDRETTSRAEPPAPAIVNGSTA
ncbi:hypothetical protein LTS18_008875 [Coniosporium uncinatum]|uniref:Uncharacterized protein n=1 Tax=Coniosporium uncinatum TaxID=93489 RepID=A0ACC3DWQ2_9PEZI|nr:hypothetical protein LTS18_008875 [Coniosporium uncinatum]